MKAGAPFVDVTRDGNLQRTLRNAGFKDITEKRLKLPATPWPKDKNKKLIGVYYNMHNRGGMASLTIGLFTRVLGWSIEKVNNFLEELNVAINDSSVHAYSDAYVTYARKPEK